MIAQTIQLALAPVFVLVAIGNILNILSVRMGRVVDRSRQVQARHGATSGTEHDMVVTEIRALDRRIHLIGRAMRLLVIGGLSIGMTVAALFIEEMAHVSLQQVAGGFFLIAIALLMWALTLFLRETQISAAMLRIPQDLLELDRDI
ncbi:MAG: DUF2721 domain-containing protein [Novosphingobium sp.]